MTISDLHTEDEASGPNIATPILLTDRQTDRQTDRHTQTDRQTDKHDRKHDSYQS